MIAAPSKFRPRGDTAGSPRRLPVPGRPYPVFASGPAGPSWRVLCAALQ